MKRYFKIANPFWCLGIRLRAFKQRFSQKVRYKLISMIATEYEKELVAHAVEEVRDYHYSMMNERDLSDSDLHREQVEKINYLRIALHKAGFYNKKRTIW